MSARRWVLGLATAAAVLVLFAPSAAASTSGVGGHAAAPVGVAVSHAAASELSAHALSVLNSIKAAHVPMHDVFLPNFNARLGVSNGIVSPLYTTAPAPMGLGDFGIRDVHGHNVGTISYTQSDKAVVKINSVDPFYLASSSPDWFTLQLNSVLTGVTVLNNTSGQYWIQNVPIYQASTQTLSIEDNIWNFSSPGAGMYRSTLYSYFGNVVQPTFYYATGPAWHMPTPFTIALYNNATVLNDRPTVFFNYSITAANGSIYAGTFDQVEFNSTGLATPTGPAATPSFQINGKAFDPIGLLNDEEIMIGGPGGGSTTTLLGFHATMSLATLPNGSTNYRNAPAGWGFGTDTGETSEGISVWTTGGANPVATLGEGPSILAPLWGIAGAAGGTTTIHLTVTPSNAFVFVSPGKTFSLATSAWIPMPASGSIAFTLPDGSYTVRVLLSNFNPQTHTVGPHSGGLTVNLHANTAMGVYTPLWAWNDGQLAAISQPGGAGTIAHPYVLWNNQIGLLSPLFGEVNDYFFPVFAGIFLGDTTAHVTVTAPSLAIAYTLPATAGACTFFGLPCTNNLPLQFYNAQHVALYGSPMITGWFANFVTYTSEVELWNVSHSLIANNTFGVQSVGLILSVGGSSNWVFGNVFNSATTTATSPGAVLQGTAPIGIEEYENHDLIWNNEFLTTVTAYTPPFDLYSGAFNFWSDWWNVATQPAGNPHVHDGWTLSGSILGLPTVGGNYWANYGTQSDPYGRMPYNDGGAIFVGGDWAPQTTFALYKLTFVESGLAHGTNWTVTLNGISWTTSGTTIAFWDPNGTYAFTVTPVAGYTAHPTKGAETVNGANQSRGITFT
ncbi:MAG TPA: thermopsin family protease [Thermoplasmata archaeon]|nr:thermopsin family protease [Thermoplasmata archaeon]